MGKRGRNRKVAKAKQLRRLPPNARSYELKLARADHLLQDIDEQVGEWLEACFDSLREEPDSEEAGYFCAWIDAPELDAQLLSLRVGDYLQYMRSALDHLAFELTSAFTVPMTNEIEADSAFPILSDTNRYGKSGVGGEKWRSNGAKVTRGMDPLAQAVIEGLQPYKRGQLFDSDPLWRLNALNNIDKHRAIHVATWVMSGATMPVAGPRIPKKLWPRNVAGLGFEDGRMSTITVSGDIEAEGRTLVARWVMRPIDPSKKMHMGFCPVLDVVFDAATPLVGGSPVTEIRAIYNYVVANVIPPLSGFLK